MRRFPTLIKSIFFDWKRFSCYLLIAAGILTTRTLLLQIFVNINLIPIPFLAISGISLNVSGISIFLTLMKCLLPNILSLGLLQGLHPTCSVLTFCLLILKSIPLPTGFPSLRSILFMLSSVDLILTILQMLVLFAK